MLHGRHLEKWKLFLRDNPTIILTVQSSFYVVVAMMGSVVKQNFPMLKILYRIAFILKWQYIP